VTDSSNQSNINLDAFGAGGGSVETFPFANPGVADVLFSAPTPNQVAAAGVVVSEKKRINAITVWGTPIYAAGATQQMSAGIYSGSRQRITKADFTLSDSFPTPAPFGGDLDLALGTFRLPETVIFEPRKIYFLALWFSAVTGGPDAYFLYQASQAGINVSFFRWDSDGNPEMPDTIPALTFSTRTYWISASYIR